MNADLPPEIIAKKRARRAPSEYLLPDKSKSSLKDDEFGSLYASRWAPSIQDYVAWYFSYKPILHSVSWMGVPTRKFVTDLWIYQELLHERKPEIIVEIGSLFGGTTLYLAHLCDLMDNGRVISVDLTRQVYQVSHPRITEITGTSGDPEIIAEVQSLCRNKTTMVIHDGSHIYEQVLNDLTQFAPLVSRGQYLIVEDGVVDIFKNVTGTLGRTYHENFPSGGPLKALDAFLRQFPEQFEIDDTRERFLITAAPRGYLLRTSLG